MFGSVPKILWEQNAKPDRNHAAEGLTRSYDQLRGLVRKYYK